ncbi:MAG: glycoside hydrolase family 25 protein [Candidatus Limivicinus sp.]|nr:glycoside hydrolase family 25 protein [Clostridiales bacterium]MDY6132402.1 glycoside hydrolase family 25 protein [Candidatus Limivicinus sp.]
MKTAVKYRLILIAIAVLVLAAAVVIVALSLRPEPVDPHEGQVYIYDGFDWIWMTPLPGVEANSLTAEDFSDRSGYPTYTGSDYQVLRGIDVSEHQHEIDWAQVAASGVDYAYVRLGYRGYTEGGLFEDPYFRANVEGALANGLQVSVYFFSQAISVQEAIEEAEYVLARIRDYNITLPVVYDWEKINGETAARTDNLDFSILNDCAVAFCDTVKNAGYEPAIYFNRHLGYYGYDLSRMTDYDFWFALPESSFPNFYYAVDMWQYSFTEQVPGIAEPTDMNLMFIPLETGKNAA